MQDQIPWSLAGSDESSVFLCGSPHQIEKLLRAKKVIVEWVGTSKERKNSMHDCLTALEALSQNSRSEPEEPTPTKDEDPVGIPCSVTETSDWIPFRAIDLKLIICHNFPSTG